MIMACGCEDLEAVKVHLAGSDIPIGMPPPVRPHRGVVFKTVTLTANDPVQQILPLSPHRREAWIQAFTANVVLYSEKGQAQVGGNNGLTIPAAQLATGGAYSGGGAVAAPTAGQTIATIPAASLPAGRYRLRVNAGFGANAEATTDFNFDLLVNGAVFAGRLMVTAASNNVRNWIFDDVALNGTSPVTLVAHTGASASAVYVGDITASLETSAQPGVPYPLNTTDPVWATAATLPATVCVTAIIDGD